MRHSAVAAPMIVALTSTLYAGSIAPVSHAQEATPRLEELPAIATSSITRGVRHPEGSPVGVSRKFKLDDMQDPEHDDALSQPLDEEECSRMISEAWDVERDKGP